MKALEVHRRTQEHAKSITESIQPMSFLFCKEKITQAKEVPCPIIVLRRTSSGIALVPHLCSDAGEGAADCAGKNSKDHVASHWPQEIGRICVLLGGVLLLPAGISKGHL